MPNRWENARACYALFALISLPRGGRRGDFPSPRDAVARERGLRGEGQILPEVHNTLQMFIGDMAQTAFYQDVKTQDAVIRRIEISSAPVEKEGWIAQSLDRGR
jgi:hypothetical protein